MLRDPDSTEDRKYKVGIIGAGAAGLFTGLIFDHLKEEYGLDVDYEILELHDEDRLGGRLYTHYFGNQEENLHDYYDVGAMRFPDSPVMSRYVLSLVADTQRLTLSFRAFDLFTNELGMKRKGSNNGAKPGDLVYYYLQGINNTELYNDVLVRNNNKDGKSTSTANTFRVTGLPPEYVKAQAFK